jgi:DNA-binding transcriptional ArsR family regulator
LTSITITLTIVGIENQLDATLSALADPTRRRVVDLLREGPRAAGDLAAAARMSPPAMSRHLRVLRGSGLVEVDTDQADARRRLYRLRPDPLVGLQAWLDQVESFWSEQLGAFQAHARAVEPTPGVDR